MSEDLPVLNAWSDFLDWFFDTLDRFPKKVRFTLTTRLLNLRLTEDPRLNHRVRPLGGLLAPSSSEMLRAFFRARRG